MSVFFFSSALSSMGSPNYIIASRFNLGVSIAIPAVVLGINRRLYLLASPTSVIPSEQAKRREIMIDIAIGVGLPIIVIILCSSCYCYLHVSLTHPTLQRSSVKRVGLSFMKTLGVIHGCLLPGSESLLYPSRQSFWNSLLVFMGV